MIDIDQLLEDRGKVHGDAQTTHCMAMELFEIAKRGSNMTKAGEAMLFLIMVKIARGVQKPNYADHWDDICGYSRLIREAETGDE